MKKPGKWLQGEGYEVCNIGYPSRHYGIVELAEKFVAPAVRECVGDGGEPVYFVTHSLGGIVVRQLAEAHRDIAIGRVVMISPPSQGTELVDRMKGWWLFKLINGPAGGELGTGVDSVPNRLGAVDFELGVITGDNGVMWFSKMIPGEDDGRVSVERARQEGMGDFLVVPYSHTFIMAKDDVIRQTLHFLEAGEFNNDSEAGGANDLEDGGFGDSETGGSNDSEDGGFGDSQTGGFNDTETGGFAATAN